ncbi:MAG: extracellular solute-binding protein [Burkholderiales bacterium]
MKRILVLIIALVSLVVFAACTPQTAEESPASEAPSQPEAVSTPEPATESPAAQTVTLKFAAQADSTPATQAAIDAFNASQSAYKVEWVEMTNDSGQMHDQLLTSLRDSAEYDIVSLDVVWAGEFAAAGYIEPLDMMMSDAGLKKADYNSGSMASGAYQGKQYVLPFFPDLGLLYIRSDIVSAEDISKLVSGSYTWDDLLAMAEKYAGQGGTEAGIVFQAKQYEGLVCNLTEFSGGFADVKGGLETMKKFVDSKAVPVDILNYTEGETNTSFIEGKSVFARNWPYQYGVITMGGEDVTIKPEQVTVAPLPKGDTVGGWLLAINKQSANKEGAFEFIKFLSGEQGQKIMATNGYVPGWNALLNDAEVAAKNPMLTMDGFKAAVAKTIPRPVSAEYSKLSDTIQINAHKYLSGSQDIDTTVSAIQAAIG